MCWSDRWVGGVNRKEDELLFPVIQRVPIQAAAGDEILPPTLRVDVCNKVSLHPVFI